MAENQKPFQSLSQTIRFATIVAFFIITGSLCAEFFFNFQTQSKLIATQQRVIASGAADTVRTFVSEQLKILDQAADINSLADNPDRRELVIGKLIGRNLSFRNILLIDNSGAVLQKASRFSESGIPFQNWQEPVLEGTRIGTTYISAVYIDPVTNEPLILIAVPAKDKFKDSKGALVAVVNLKFMWDLVDSIKVGQSGAAYVVDRGGYLIAYKDTSLVLARRNASDLAIVRSFVENGTGVTGDDFNPFSKGIDGVWVVSSHEHLGTPDWAVVVEMPAEEAYQPILEVLIPAILLVMLGIFLIMLLSRYFTATVITPTIQLRNMVTKIGTANLNTVIDIHAPNEIGELATAFNGMTARLGQSYHDLADEKARLIASINSLSFGFVIADANDQILLKNPALMQILELKTEPKSIHDVAESFKNIEGAFIDFDPVGSCRECMETRKVIELKKVSFGKKFLRVFCAPIYTGNIPGTNTSGTEIIGYVFLVEDITEAQIMERSRDEFFAVASHELRTPLTAIRGNSDMIIQMYADKIVDKDMKEMLEDINNSSLRLIGIVNDFLEASRLEQGRIDVKKETFNISELLEKVTRDSKALVEQSGVMLVYTPAVAPLNVFADRNRVEQVLINLIGNAAKFTKQGTITITTEVKGGFLKISVTDTGSGMSEHAQALLFRKFQPAGEDSLARDVSKSTGLGLYISKLIVSALGGTIDLEKSEVGKGSTFFFTLPTAAPTIPS